MRSLSNARTGQCARIWYKTATAIPWEAWYGEPNPPSNVVFRTR
jgi:hypothetical protein